MSGLLDYLGLGGLFGGADPSQQPQGLLGPQQPQQPYGGPLLPPQVTDPLTGVAPNQQKWMDALGGLAAGLKDAGAYLQHQPEAATNVANFNNQRQERLQRQQQVQDYHGLLNYAFGQTPTPQVSVTQNLMDLPNADAAKSVMTANDVVGNYDPARSGGGYQFAPDNSGRVLNPDGTPAASTGGVLSNSPYAGLRNAIGGMSPAFGAQLVQAALNNATRLTDLGPGHQLLNGTGQQIANNQDETYGEPVRLPNGQSVRFGDRGGVKLLPSALTPAMQVKLAQPGETPINPYTGRATGQALGGFKTISPVELGLTPGALPPGTILQQSPTGEIIIKKASDLKSPGAFQQDVDLAGADATARAKAAMAVNNPTAAGGRAIGTLGSSAIDATVPGYSTQAISEAGGLTQSAIDQGALEYAITGKLPPGMGFGSTGIGGLRKTAIQNRAGELNAGGNVAANAAQLRALQGSLAQQTKYADTVERSVNNAENGFNQVVTAFQGKVNTSSFPIVNAMKNAALYQLSPGDVSALKAGLTELGNEYSNVFARGGQVTDAVRGKANAIINGNLSIDDLKQVQAELQAQGNIIKNGARSQAQKIQGQFNSILGGGQAQTPAAAPAGVIMYDKQGNRIQ